MPDELETRLERALAALPGPDEAAAERAVRAALAALPEPRPARTWRLPLLLVAALAAVLGAAAGVTLAATGTTPFSDRAPSHPATAGHAAPPRRPRPHRPPPGVLATYAGGRLWLGATHGRPFSAVELSPGGLYVAVGEPGRLSVYTPDLRRRVWSHRVAGTVVAIAWRPLGTEIAYVVHGRHANALRLIQADGDHDQLVDAAVAPVTPSWRWDSQAFAYVGAGGRVAVRDLIHARTDVVRLPHDCPAGPVQSVAFAPAGRARSWLAGALVDANAFAANPLTGQATCFSAPPDTIGPAPAPLIAWTPGGDLLCGHFQFVARLRLARGHVTPLGYSTAPAGIAGLVVAPSGGSILVALVRETALREVVAALPPRHGQVNLRVLRVLPALPVRAPHTNPATLFWR